MLHKGHWSRSVKVTGYILVTGQARECNWSIFVKVTGQALSRELVKPVNVTGRAPCRSCEGQW